MHGSFNPAVTSLHTVCVCVSVKEFVWRGVYIKTIFIIFEEMLLLTWLYRLDMASGTEAYCPEGVSIPHFT